MAHPHHPPSDDPHDLQRFVQAQQGDYDQALSELHAGRKTSHWMWYIFPQFAGLGSSAMSQHYAIKSITEAQAYLSHPVLGPRLLDCAAALLAIEGKSARQILGSPDDLKLHSCATLFSLVSPPDSLFHQLLNKFFENHPDQQTLQLTATPTQRRDLP